MREFICGRSRLVGITEATEDAEGGVVRWNVVEAYVGHRKANGLGGANVDKIRGRGKGFGPVGRWHRRLEKKCTNDVIDGADGTLGLAILGRRVRTREAKVNAVGGE